MARMRQPHQLRRLMAMPSVVDPWIWSCFLAHVHRATCHTSASAEAITNDSSLSLLCPTELLRDHDSSAGPSHRTPTALLTHQQHSLNSPCRHPSYAWSSPACVTPMLPTAWTRPDSSRPAASLLPAHLLPRLNPPHRQTPAQFLICPPPSSPHILLLREPDPPLHALARAHPAGRHPPPLHPPTPQPRPLMTLLLASWAVQPTPQRALHSFPDRLAGSAHPPTPSQPQPRTQAIFGAACQTSGPSTAAPAPTGPEATAAPSTAVTSSRGSSQGSSQGSSKGAPAASGPDPVWNLPNAVSAARLVSGPVIGYWLLQGEYEVATMALAVSGASDWLDGFLARRTGTSSVFGSYLDPLADKVLIGCVAAALLVNGAMPVWLAGVVVGRDVLLVSGAFVLRLRGFGWRWPGREAFFRTLDAGAAASGSSSGSGDAKGGGAGSEAAGVPFMRPLLVSKANTVLQLVLLGGYLTRGMYGWPEGDLVAGLELATAATTVASLAAYGRKALEGKLFK